MYLSTIDPLHITSFDTNSVLLAMLKDKLTVTIDSLYCASWAMSVFSTMYQGSNELSTTMVNFCTHVVSSHQFLLLCVPLLRRHICNHTWIARKESVHLPRHYACRRVEMHSLTNGRPGEAYTVVFVRCPPTWRLATVALVWLASPSQKLKSDFTHMAFSWEWIE